MFINKRAESQDEKMRDGSRKQIDKQELHLMVNVGDARKCPECETMGRVVWVSEDKTRMGVQCHASHQDSVRTGFKYGATKAHSIKSRKNVVFLTATKYS
jgi:hypothetical protein